MSQPEQPRCPECDRERTYWLSQQSPNGCTRFKAARCDDCTVEQAIERADEEAAKPASEGFNTGKEAR